MSILFIAQAAAAASPPAHAQSSLQNACNRAAAIAERRWDLPEHLLLAIGEVESGRLDTWSGQRLPWPWTINVAGIDYRFSDMTAASTAVVRLQGHGVTSIDIGCFQVNLHYHPDAFASPAQGFEPQSNAEYAGSYLRALFDRSGSWEQAIGDYHSADPARGALYRAQVLQAWRSQAQRLERWRVPAIPLDPHVILATAGTYAIPVYTPATLPPSLRMAAASALPLIK